MNTPEHKQDLIAYGSVVGLALVWGSSFALTHVALGAFDPVTVAALRVLFAALAMPLVLRLAGLRLPRDPRIWVWSAGLGLVGLLLPFTLLAWGQLRVPTTVAAIYISGSPLLVLLLARVILREAVAARKWAGFAIGLAGIGVLLGPSAGDVAGAPLISQLACLGAAGCYACSGILIRLMPPMNPVEGAVASQLTAGVMALPLLPFVLPQTLPGPGPLVAVAVLGLVQTGFAHLLRYAVVRRSGPVFMSMVSYLIPVWAGILGVAFLGERLGPRDLAAFALIVGGLALAQSRRRAPPAI